MMFQPFQPAALLLAAVLALAACQSAEERAERHFRSGMELLEAGDVDRALVEFRNVFDNDPLHREARLTYARLQRERGRMGEAFGQYLRAAEQYPDDLEARRALAEMAILNADWEQAERHARAARGLAPADPAVLLANAMVDYRAARLAEDAAAAEAAVAVARDRLAADPGDLIARRMVVDFAAAGGDAAEARAELDAAVAAHPDELPFHMLRLRLVAAAGDDAATGAALETMADRFPDSAEARGLLLSWYLSRDDLAAAEAFLRRRAEAPGAGLEAKVGVVEFLQRTRGSDAALAELDRLIAAGGETRPLRALRAGIDFGEGRTAEAVAAMEALVEGAEPGVETRDLKTALARMLVAEGNAVGARARVEEVLAEDSSHVGALKLRAAWLIDDDRPGEAVAALRIALAEAPRDADALTLMARAHEREGARQLAGERYAMAVEASGRAPEESRRYAAFLMDDGRADAAAAVLEEALAAAPGNVALLAALAEVELGRGGGDRVARIVWQLRGIGSPAAVAAADAVEVARLLRQDRVDETLGFLEGVAAQGGDAGTAARARMVRIQIDAGRVDEARALVEAGLAEAPQDPVLRHLRAGLHVLDGEPAEAEAIYRALLSEAPAAERPLVALQGLLRAQGRDDEAMAAIDAAIAAAPEAPGPRLLKAGQLERRGDIEGAIAVYEALYAADSANLVVANNLASLISSHRADPESLERAAIIARRLRDSDVPAFQDTYGWIEHRRGNHEEALKRLEPAAAGLPEDPLVQIHLGLAYRALGRSAEARDTLARALALAGDRPLPQLAEARAALAEMGGE